MASSSRSSHSRPGAKFVAPRRCKGVVSPTIRLPTGAAAVVWPLAARAQQAAVPVIGLLDPRTPDAMADRLRAFRLGLKDVGYVEGENVTIIYRFAEDQ